METAGFRGGFRKTAPVQAKERMRLAVIQASPFCNIDCAYCYLPDRSNRKIISDAVLENIFNKLSKSPHYYGELDILWHCGEPLAVGREFFINSITMEKEIFKGRGNFKNVIQTNATLIDERWIDLFSAEKFDVGVSVDGPKFIHDSKRITRRGGGTFDKAMRGVKLLQEAGVKFGCIAVLSRISLSFPEELCHFFATSQISWVGFNVQEVDGCNKTSDVISFEKEYATFWLRFFDEWLKLGRPFAIREMIDLLQTIKSIKSQKEDFDEVFRPDETVPMRIVSFDVNGNFSTFAPELLGITSEKYDNFHVGNVARDEIDESTLSNHIFISDILDGINLCKSSCEYYSVCGGGFVSNRFAEFGSFSAGETSACRLHKKVFVGAALDWIENGLQSKS